MDAVSNAGKAPLAKRGGGNRRIQVAAAVFVALGLGIGYAYAVPAAAGKPIQTAAAKATAISAATEVCPIVVGASQGSMAAYTPANTGGVSGQAIVNQLGSSTALATLTAPGTYATGQNLSGSVTNLAEDSLPLVGQAKGGLAPGFTLDGVLESGNSGTDDYGLASAACVQPDTSFWFIGAGTDANPLAQLNMADTDSLTAQVDVAEYDSAGLMSNAAQTVNQGLVVQSGGQSSPPGQLIDPANPPGAIALHVTATTGRVTAGLLAGDSKGGGRDFVAAQVPAANLVIPGIPAAPSNTTIKLQLMLMATSQDADVTLKWIGKSSFTPSVTVPHLSAGHVQSVDISSIPAPGESGALEITSTGGTPIIGAIKLTYSSGGSTDSAYLTPVTALTGDAVVAANRPGSSVILTNNSSQPAQVTITASAQPAVAPATPTPTSTSTHSSTATPSSTASPSATPSATPDTVTVPPNSTMAVPLTGPSGSNEFAIMVTPQSGTGQIYAARVMTGSGPLVTVQAMSTALEAVLIPPVRSDLSGTVPQN